jgi:hypothetical protein
LSRGERRTEEERRCWERPRLERFVGSGKAPLEQTMEGRGREKVEM